MDFTKYQYPQIFEYKQRTWPDKKLTKAPIWCSVDLRDGNQSLEIPMTLEQKLKFFQFLVQIGFKEIEVGFPAASDTEFQFVRNLIEKDLIPDDVTIQVLTQSREEIIRRSFESLRGVRRAVVHLYNSTSPLQRKVVFNKTKEEVLDLAVFGANLFNKISADFGREEFIFQYSPESFSQTEPDYAVDVCNAVLECWKGRKSIINLPFTVETFMPNVHADMVEYMCAELKGRENVVVSLHTHNDRGTGVAATELCLLAGADRVEGTLFGNGERTGNADIVTLAMNLYSHGIDPGLDFSDIDKAIEIYTAYTSLPVHPRHPYAGDLVYSAFSGSHQDAIRKGMAVMKTEGSGWAVPYLPIDPKDVGRSYDPIVRFNSQSGSSASAYILETNYDIIIPKPMQRDFGPLVISLSDKMSAELSPKDIYQLFKDSYVNIDKPSQLLNWKEQREGDSCHLTGTLLNGGKEIAIDGFGDGIVEGFCNALLNALGLKFDITHYSQHALESGREARAITYVGIISDTGKTCFGVGVSRNITVSSLKGVLSALNRMIE